MLDTTKLQEDIKNSPVIVHNGRYAYLKSDTIPSSGYFMISKDQDEITIIAEEKDITNISHDAETKWYTLIEIQTSSPFLVAGFIAAITTAIASRGLTVLAVSTYSKDYFLVHEKELKIAIDALKSIGFEIN